MTSLIGRLTGTTRVDSLITCVDQLSFPFKTPDPFLFCVYHKDDYPAGDEKMQGNILFDINLKSNN